MRFGLSSGPFTSPPQMPDLQGWDQTHHTTTCYDQSSSRPVLTPSIRGSRTYIQDPLQQSKIDRTQTTGGIWSMHLQQNVAKRKPVRLGIIENKFPWISSFFPRGGLTETRGKRFPRTTRSTKLRPRPH